MNGTYGITITGGVAVITLSVPALWWVAVTLLAGLFLTWTTVREWIGGVLARVWQEDKKPARVGTGWASTTDLIQPCAANTHKGSMKIWE